ncbi:MAG: BamA/TamA family outer membrane protein [Ignavibacteriaceae bacterium]|nr:BamA/TamA family outer membrane protein [Ignavibacteriaceae bacterium]
MIYKIFFFIFFFGSALFAQIDLQHDIIYPVRIDSVTISGNEITEPDIVLRELTFKTGESVTKEDLDYNRDRIYSLGIFTKVELLITREKQYNKLIIYLDESWYIYPIPFAELKDRDWNKISYGVDVFIKNFRGRNESLRGRIGLGYDPSFRLEYYNPRLIVSQDIFFGVNFLYVNANNKSSIAEVLHGNPFEQKFINGSISLGKRFDLYNRLALFATFNYVETPFYIKGINAFNGRIDRIPSLGLQYSYDTRDLAQFPHDGILGMASAEIKGLGFDNVNYMIYNFDYRQYQKIYGNLGSKWRTAARITSGEDVPYYDYSFIGYSERIRGHYQDEREGNIYYITSAELNYPIIRDVNINFDFVPIIPHELLRYRVALYVQAFGDAGATRLSGQKINIKNFSSGYGAGLTLLILPYNIARLEVAFDEYNNMQWIFDLGISF